MLSAVRPYASRAGRGAMWLLFYFALLGMASNAALAALSGNTDAWAPALFCGQVAIIALFFARRS